MGIGGAWACTWVIFNLVNANRGNKAPQLAPMRLLGGPEWPWLSAADFRRFHTNRELGPGAAPVEPLEGLI